MEDFKVFGLDSNLFFSIPLRVLEKDINSSTSFALAIIIQKVIF